MTASRWSVPTVPPFVRMAGRAAMGTLAVIVIFGVLIIGVGLGSGYRPVIITTGSMTPTAPAGSLVIAGPSERVHPGDILVMRRDGRATVTHRIVEIEYNADGAPYAITRGDANAEIDAAPYALGGEELTGRWVVPGFGRLLLAMGSPLVAISVMTLAVSAIAFGALRRIWATEEPAPMPVAVRPERGGSQRLRMAAGATVLGVTLAGGGVAWSLYLSVASVGSNVFATAECFDARLAGVQKGQVTSTAEQVETVTIGSVDPSRSFLLFSVRSSSAESADSQVMGTLVDATTLEFHRRTDAATPPVVEIEWSVVEYACGVAVQRGVIPGDSTSQIDVPIAAVDPGTSFVTVSSAPDRADADFGADDLQIAELAAGDTLRVRTAGAPLSSGRSIAWQVVTFTDPGDATAQVVTTTLGPADGSASLTLGSPVDPRTTIVLATVASSSSGAEIGERTVRAHLVDSSTVEVARLLTTESIEVHVQVVEITDGTTVRRGILDLDPGETSAAVTIPALDPSRTTVGSTVMVPGSHSGGATDSATGGVVGEASATARLVNPATVAVERQSATAAASFAWQAVTWGGPSWADPLSPFRQRIDVTAAGVDAPNGYTTPLTFDHAALVDAGLALADGRDARVWRYDGSGWIELDRVLDDNSGWNQPSTTIWFRTQESIAAGERISYWLYFGNESPPPVLDDPDNVWLLREGFEDGTLGAFEDRTAGTAWYRALPWTRRQQLTVDAANVASALTDQAVLVRLTDPDLTASAQPDGSDFRFTAADGVTLLPHEIESWDPATNTLTAWVRLPFISAASDTGLYLYYGALDAPDQQATRQVWVNDLAAWNLARDPAGPAPTLDDSSTGNHDGLALADTAAISTPTGPGVVLDGTTDRLEAAPFDLPDGGFTVAAWFRADGLGTDPAIAAQGDPTGTGVFELGIDTTTVPASPAARFVLRVNGAPVEVSGGLIATGTWHHVAATWDGSNITLYLDGASVGTAPAAGLTPNGSAMPVVLGGTPDGSRTLQGALGQVRVGDGAWTPAQVGFVEANLRNPSGAIAASGAVGGTWFDQGDWTIRRPLAVDRTLVTGSLTDYPLLVQLVDADLAANAQADGDDLVFVAADGVTRLDHDIERWDSATGALTAWVRLPVLDDASDTRLYLYLGNPAAADQTDPEAVFGGDADLVAN